MGKQLFKIGKRWVGAEEFRKFRGLGKCEEKVEEVVEEKVEEVVGGIVATPEALASATAKYIEQEGKEVPNRYKNDLGWIESKLK